MSQGAIFKLVLRDERFDQFFTASDYLRQRLDAIRLKRKAAGEKNIQPTFVDVERSHLLYIHAVYRPYVSVASEYARVKASGDGTASLGPSGGTLQFTFPIFGHFTSDLAIHISLRAIGTQSATATPSASTPLLRYCALPGLRVFRKVELRSDQVLIDDYEPDDAVAWSKFFVHTDQRAGWERCHGQQDLREASFLANGFSGTLLYRDGAQTPKLFQDTLDLFIPLQFWLCRDAAHALLNDLVPNTQRVITCELAPLAQIVQALIPDPLNPGSLVATPLPFTNLKMEANLYVNGLYVNPEIHDIFASRIGFSLIRVHRRDVKQLQSSADQFLLDQLKFPAEFLMVGMRARANLNDFDHWWLMGAPAARTDTNKLIVPAMVWNTGLGVCQLVCREATDVSTLDSFTSRIGVTAHGVEIFPQFPAIFYNSYMPIRYAENSMVVSPLDTSEFLVNFCLYPGKFQTSGYYNLSAGRELYINYALKASFADVQPSQTEMVISMSALNFLMRKGDKIHLRYAL